MVLLGKGDGTFRPAISCDTPGEARAILAADMDGDGKLDLVVGNERGVYVLRGHGDGTFDPARTTPALLSTRSLFAADLDRDGKLDLLVWDATGSFVVLHGNGDGTFRPGQVQTAPSVAKVTDAAATLGDFDGDGKADLAFVYRAGTEQGVGVLLGDGGGSFRRTPGLRLDGGQDPSAVTAADFDGDGKLDLAVGVANGTAVLALLSHGDGTFGGGSYYGVSGAPAVLRTVDFDGDGKVDIVAVGNGVLTWLRGRGDGTFHGERAFLGPVGARHVVCGDFNGDGLPSCVATTDQGPARYTTWRGDGRGSFALAASGPLGGDDARPEVAAVDLNGDGKLDLVSAHRATVLPRRRRVRAAAELRRRRRPPGRGRRRRRRQARCGADHPAGAEPPLAARPRRRLLRHGAHRRRGRARGARRPGRSRRRRPARSDRGDGHRAGPPLRPLLHAARAPRPGCAGGQRRRGRSRRRRTARSRRRVRRPQRVPGAPQPGAPHLPTGGAPRRLRHPRRPRSRRRRRPRPRRPAVGSLRARGQRRRQLRATAGFGAGDDSAIADVDRDGRPDLILVQNGNPFLRLLHNASR